MTDPSLVDVSRILINDDKDGLDGNVFDGTVEMFMDCFFSNPTVDNIIDWALHHGWSVRFEREGDDVWAPEDAPEYEVFGPE